MLDLERIDLEEVATALADGNVGDHHWLIDPRSGKVLFWTSDLGIDGENPVDLDDLDHLVLIEALPPSDRYRDMADFAQSVGDRAAGERLSRALAGKGAFRRFGDELHRRHPDLISVWYAFRDVRARVRAVQWLADQGLVDDDAAQRFARDNPDVALP